MDEQSKLIGEHSKMLKEILKNTSSNSKAANPNRSSSPNQFSKGGAGKAPGSAGGEIR